jgi:hypothetical protein
MSTAATEIERLVREVLAELATAQRPAPDAPAPVAAAPRAAAADGGQLTVAVRVVTMSELIGRLEGLRQLVVLPEAIVTPAVRDELRRRNVELLRSAPARDPQRGALRLVLIVAGKPLDTAPLSEALGRDGVAVEHHAMDCLIAATDLLTGEVVKPDTLGVLATPHWAAALCLANRRPGIRAVLGLDVPAAAAATAAVGANLLVIDPDGGTMFQWKQMLGEFCRGGIRGCPAVFGHRLG